MSFEGEFDGSDLSDNDGFHSNTDLMVLTHLSMMDVFDGEVDGSFPYDHDGFHSKTNFMVLTFLTMIDFTQRMI